MSGRIADWLDHYLKGTAVDTGPEFSYFRDWVSYTGIATPAYADSATYPVGSPTSYYLSGSKLVTDQSQIATGKQSFITPPGGLPSSFDELDAVRSLPIPPLPLPEKDLDGTFAAFTSAPNSADVDVVGSPRLTVKVDAPTAVASQGLNPGKLVLFMKVLDVDADGKATLIRNLDRPGARARRPQGVHRDAARLRAPLRVRPLDPSGRRRRLDQLPRRAHPDPGQHRHRQRQPGADAAGRPVAGLELSK